jgi:hypothetical protein
MKNSINHSPDSSIMKRINQRKRTGIVSSEGGTVRPGTSISSDNLHRLYPSSFPLSHSHSESQPHLISSCAIHACKTCPALQSLPQSPPLHTSPQPIVLRQHSNFVCQAPTPIFLGPLLLPQHSDCLTKLFQASPLYNIAFHSIPSPQTQTQTQTQILPRSLHCHLLRNRIESP